MQTLVILGAGGQGKVVCDIALKTGRYGEIVFLNDALGIQECMGFPIVGNFSDFYKYLSVAHFIVAVGDCSERAKWMQKLSENKADFATLIHPSAVIGKNVIIGEGTVIAAGAVINPCAKIGKGVILNTCSSIDHDCIVRDYSHISVDAHLAGKVEIGACTWIGIGAVVRDKVSVCENCLIGAGAVVVKDIAESGVYVGVPAKKMR